MIEKATITWATHEPDFNHLLVCLSYLENPKGFQGHSFSIMITMGCFPLCFTMNRIVVLKLFDVFCRFIFDPGGQSPNTLIIRDCDGGVVRDRHMVFRAVDGIMPKTFKEISD